MGSVFSQAYNDHKNSSQKAKCVHISNAEHILASGELQANPSSARFNDDDENFPEFAETLQCQQSPYQVEWPAAAGVFEKQMLMAKLGERQRVKAQGVRSGATTTGITTT